MKNSKLSVSELSEREALLTRIIDVPREIVFDAWTKSEHVSHWMLGPDGWTMPVCEIDLRAGGKWHFGWRNSDGTEMAMDGEYHEVVAPERLVCSESWGGDWPVSLNTLTLTEEEGRTTMALAILYPSKEAREAAFSTGMVEGMTLSYNRLEDYLTNRIANSTREFILTRLFNAPRESVFKAWTDSSLLSQWSAPRGFSIPFCETDLRPGGAYRTVMRSPEGIDYPQKGIYHEIVPSERLVMTDDCTDHPAEWHEAIYKTLPPGAGKPSLNGINTITFEAQDGKTLLTIRTLFASTEVRDAMVKVGLEDGWSQCLERLEGLVQTM